MEKMLVVVFDDETKVYEGSRTLINSTSKAASTFTPKRSSTKTKMAPSR